MSKKLLLYWHTIRGMKPSQVYYRIRKILNLSCSLNVQPAAMPSVEQLFPISPVEELDYDEDFLTRFPLSDFMNGTVTFLHEKENFTWNEQWKFENRSSLWNFNLHYFEYQYPLIWGYVRNENVECYQQLKKCICGWIDHNPQRDGGYGWAPYTLAVRLSNWVECYSLLAERLDHDADFQRKFACSIYEQYCYLAAHLEKDLLANHYMEDLKALVLCSVFFKDEKMYAATIKEYKNQCREQILPDGMHYELSPMYHKIILEGIIRIAAVIRMAGSADKELETYIQKMLDVAYSMENGLARLPLFNDCGCNISKSLEAILSAAKNQFDLLPEYKSTFADSGYYLFKEGDWTLIVDAGETGPRCNPGHSHCDAMSFELFHCGKPVLVNCGTYAYQHESRSFFRSTAAHNTVKANGIEQSQCWGAFRLGKAADVSVIEVSESGITMRLRDQIGQCITRSVRFTNKHLIVEDEAEKKLLHAYYHMCPQDVITSFDKDKCLSIVGTPEFGEDNYAVDYGKTEKVTTLTLSGHERVRFSLDFTVI